MAADSIFSKHYDGSVFLTQTVTSTEHCWRAIEMTWMDVRHKGDSIFNGEVVDRRQGGVLLAMAELDYLYERGQYLIVNFIQEKNIYFLIFILT